MRKLLPASELASFLAALAHPPAGLRVNALKLSGSRFREISPFAVQPLDFAPEAFLLGEEERAGKHPYHEAGLYYLQDPSAMAVGVLAGARPGERVLDIAAAPGGKATHLAASMAGRGTLFVNDVSGARASELLGNIERCGVRNAVVTSETAERLVRSLGPYFDRVLVDAPCSGESMFHKSAAARSDWSEAAVAGCAVRQSVLLQHAAALVRPGGSLFYSTCTFSREENEDIVGKFLDRHAGFQPQQLHELAGADPAGATSIRVGPAKDPVAREGLEAGEHSPQFSSGVPASGQGEFALRMWPHRFPGAGHFIAGFRRTDGEEERATPSFFARADPGAVRLQAAFFAEVLPHLVPDPERIAQFGDDLYELPAEMPATTGLRVLRSGLRLGSVLPGRFEPAHALALALPAGDGYRALNLDRDDPRLPRYLQGHPVEASGAAGWLVIQVDGFPLGWAKRVGTVVKNHYPKGLRWRG